MAELVRRQDQIANDVIRDPERALSDSQGLPVHSVRPPETFPRASTLLAIARKTSADSDGEVAAGIQHGTATLGIGLQTARTTSHPAEATGAWRYGKRCAFPTSPHPRRRLPTDV